MRNQVLKISDIYIRAFTFSFFENVSERIFNPVEISNVLNKFREKDIQLIPKGVRVYPSKYFESEK